VTAEPIVLEVEDLVVRYPIHRGIVGTVTRQPRRTVHAVEGISLSVHGGEMLALVGESGCGKTTTAQALLRLVDPVSGSIRFDGRDLVPLGSRELRPLRRRIQVVYQDPYESLDPRFRVRAVVEEPLLIHGLGGSKAQRAARVREALSRVELSPPELYLDRYPHELSGGQRQRVVIARALAPEPNRSPCSTSRSGPACSTCSTACAATASQS
jgi:peptide/nickel transport system ATP-binding protein